MDATHFRRRAASAREMAQSGEDIRLSQMLLDVAIDLEAEAAAIDAAEITEKRRFHRMRRMEIQGAVLHLIGLDHQTWPVRVVNLSAGGASVRIEHIPTPGSEVILELPNHALHLNGVIVRVRGMDVAIVFDAASSADPRLDRALRATCKDTIGA